MQDVNVVVVFCSRGDSAERLALAAAVGAVQGRANIRLRRLPDTAGERTPAIVSGWQEYVAPREADGAWMDALLLVAPVDFDAAAMEAETVKTYLDMLALNGKPEHRVDVPPEPRAEHLDSARLQGRRVAEAVREARKRTGV